MSKPNRSPATLLLFGRAIHPLVAMGGLVCLLLCLCPCSALILPVFLDSSATVRATRTPLDNSIAPPEDSVPMLATELPAPTATLVLIGVTPQSLSSATATMMVPSPVLSTATPRLSTPTRVVPSTATRQPSATTVRSRNCDPAYPAVCIPPPPPDLDCKDIPYKRFRVLPPDPHQFDNDKNGIGCES